MNIFVAKLSPSTDEDGLKRLFGQYGDVSSAKVIMDRDTGKSKCYGFVEMDDNGGSAAIENLNETEFDGYTIVVKESAPREGGGGGNRGGGGGNSYNRRGPGGGGGGFNRSSNNNRFDNRGGGNGGFNRGGDDRKGGGDRGRNDRGRNDRDGNRGGGDRYNKRDDGFDTSKWE